MGREQRFWAKVDRRGPDECWPWNAFKDSYGYGQFHTRIAKRHYTEKAHRVAWALVHGPIGEGLLVRHRCDNPPCCNPAHLKLGTHGDNMADMVARGRTRGPATLTAAEVLEIRTAAAAGCSRQQLAEQYGVSASAIWNVVTRRRWAHLPEVV